MVDKLLFSQFICIFNASFAGQIASPDEGIQPVKIVIRGS